MRRTTCRVCLKSKLEKVWDFGSTPLANSFLTKEQLDQPESYYPLEVDWCSHCNNVQLAHVVDPKLLFDNYLYASSTSKVFIKHFEDLSEKISEYTGEIIDIGSNDGILLKPFKERGWNVLGIEPAKNLADKANKKGILTLSEYFDLKLAKRIGKEITDIVTATNVFAHIDDLDSVVEGVKYILREDGLFIVEVQYLGDQLKYGYFDNVYHEHIQYWSLQALDKFFRRHGMGIISFEHIKTHGGSLRVYVKDELKPEIGRDLPTYKDLINFQNKVKERKYKTVKKLLKTKGKIIGYGAPAKSTTLLNYFGIGKDILTSIIDDSPLKQGLYTPGTHIPIVKKDKGLVYILAWNFAESIKKNNPQYKFI